MLSQHPRIKPRLEGKPWAVDNLEVEDGHKKFPLLKVVLGGPFWAWGWACRRCGARSSPTKFNFYPCSRGFVDLVIYSFGRCFLKCTWCSFYLEYCTTVSADICLWYFSNLECGFAICIDICLWHFSTLSGVPPLIPVFDYGISSLGV